jgi:hypothetical protein
MKFYKAKPVQPPRGDFYRGAGPYGNGRTGSGALTRPFPGKLNWSSRNLGMIILAIILSNAVSHGLFNPRILFMETPDELEESWRGPDNYEYEVSYRPDGELYLLEQAEYYVGDVRSFERKVREIADMLGVYPEWLMVVMYSESKFNPGVRNHKGSGATGLIQFMPSTASELSVSLERLRNMDAIQQLEYVYLYLQNVRERYGDFDSLTDLYLSILYPKARKQDMCYTLYARPSRAYRQNSGLDENRDGRVTVSDIDRRLQRMFPTAYAVGSDHAAP